VRLSSLFTIAALFFWAPSSHATSPPNLDEALRAQQAQAHQYPHDPEILNDLGNLLVLAGSLSEAEDTYIRSLEISPDNTTTRYNLGLVLMEQGHAKKATKEFHQVLELEPYHAWSLYQLGTLSASAGRRSKAVEYYTRALSLNPELASPAVNPHIIENRYLTEAQLRLYLAKAEAAQAPRLYQNPGQVAELLIPTSESETTTTPFVELITDPEALPEDQRVIQPVEPRGPVDQSGVGNDGTQNLQRYPAARWEPAESPSLDEGEMESEDLRPQTEWDDSSGADRVLTEQDLVPTTVGQGVGSIDSTRSSSSTPPPARSGGTVSYPRATTPRSGSASGTAPPQPQTVTPRPQPTPRSQSFVPTIGSTGRLDLELLVEDGLPAVASGP